MSATPETPSTRLQAAARAAGYKTASKLGRAMGMPEGTVRSALNGTRPLTASTAKRFAAFLRVSPAFLLYGVDGEPTEENQLARIADALERIAAAAENALDSDGFAKMFRDAGHCATCGQPRLSPAGGNT